MSTLKKVLALTLALAMVLSLNVFAAFKDQDQIDKDCVDAVNMMNDLGIMTGDNGNAKPLATITRAEAAAMIFRLMTGKTDATMYNGGKYFTDVVVNGWYDGYVNYCYTMGIIQGKTPTTFDPNAPVTGYELAKMLLVCAGYQSAKQGYTGANWAANVQNDAFNAGMLDDYGMSMTAPAQRQWAAVMFMDALYSNVVKYYLGDLTDTGVTLGYKKFGLETVKGILTAIQHAAVEGTVASTGYSKLKTTNSAGTAVYTEYKMVADKNLLGQQVKVLWNTKTEKVYNIAATGKSKVGTAVLGDVTKSGTDPNKKYTVGTVSATANNTVVRIPNENRVYYTAGAFSNYQGQNSNAPVRAVDTDADGDFDYIMIDFSQYATVTINAKGAVTFKGTTLAAADVADQVNYVNTVANGDFVKVTANPFTYKFDVEKMTITTATVTRNLGDGEFALGGTSYYVTDDVAGIDTSALIVGKSVDLYLDGSYIVNAATAAGTVTATMPSNMAMVTALGTQTDAYNKSTNYVKILTTDGKITEYVYDPATNYLAWSNLKVGVVYQYAVDSTDNTLSLKLFATTSKITAVDQTTAGTYSVNASKNNINGVLVAADAKLFVMYSVSGVNKFAVMTIGDLAKQDASQVQLFTTATSGINTVIMGGLVFSSKPTSSTTDVAKYAVATGDAYVEYDGTKYFVEKMNVLYMDGTTGTLVLKKMTALFDVESQYVKGTMWNVKSIDSDGVSTLAAAFVTEIAGKADVTGASGSYVQTAAKLYTLNSDCTILLKTVNGTKTTYSIGANVADLYANTGSLKTNAALKVAVLETVTSGTNAGNVSLLFVEVTLN